MRYQIARGTIYHRTLNIHERFLSRPLRTEKPVTYDEADVFETYMNDNGQQYVFALPPGALPFTHILVAARYVAKIA